MPRSRERHSWKSQEKGEDGEPQCNSQGILIKVNKSRNGKGEAEDLK
jgi:hypothetical protein